MVLETPTTLDGNIGNNERLRIIRDGNFELTDTPDRYSYRLFTNVHYERRVRKRTNLLAHENKMTTKVETEQ